MIFIIVLRELVAASLISPPDVLVISTFIVNEFEQGSASVAMAMALICVLVSAIMLFALRMLLSRMKHISAASVKKDSDTPVRVSVYLDSSASRFLADGKHCRRPEFLGRKERPNVL